MTLRNAAANYMEWAKRTKLKNTAGIVYPDAERGGFTARMERSDALCFLGEAAAKSDRWSRNDTCNTLR